MVIKQRHGPGMSRGDYINMHMDGYKARVEEGKTKYQLKSERENAEAINPQPDEVEDCPDIPFGDTDGKE